MKLENNPPAFPQTNEAMNGKGLTMLDHFAGLAMQGIMASDGNSIDQDLSSNARSGNGQCIYHIATISYDIAVAMLEARKQFID